MPAHPRYSHGEVIANKYVVDGMAGESPAAVTYLANSNAGRLAVKIYRPEVSAKLMAAPDYFLKAVIMTEIGHDNLAVCLDVQEEMGQVFVARSFVEGESFEDWARKRRGEPGHFARGLEMLWQISQGLGALHERTRHLNIHPGNVIAGPVVAKLVDPDPRALGNTEMTPDPLPLRPEYRSYRAPEMAGRGAGFLSYPSSDLFAIAGLLYRLVKGEHPSANPAQTLADAREIDRDLALFLGKALHPKPEERFQDAGAFADALWELQAVMQRLQDRMGNRPAAGERPPPQPIQPKPVEPAPVAKEATLFGTPAKPAGSDSFFDFFPADPASAAPATGGQKPPATAFPAAGKTDDGFFPEPRKPGGDTLFGAPAIPSGQPAARTEPQVRQSPPSAPSRGLADLEQPGTLFGNPATPFSPPKSAFRNEPPPPHKPASVSLSSLEKDPMESAGSMGSGGFTTYGFKGAGDNRTGIYNPDGSAAAAKAKLRLLLGIAGGVAILAGLAALFIFLRSNAAEKAKPSGAPAPLTDETPASLPPRPSVSSDRPTTGTAASGQSEPATVPPSAGERPPYPEGAETGKNTATAAESNSGQGAGYSEPPMPVEPARPSSAPEAGAPSLKPPESAPPKTGYNGNAHVTPEREAALMSMVQARDWPASAGERLKAADDLNDLGRTAEANLLYGKALIAEGVSEKQKVSALGGLAVTFQAMGMKAQAKDAVEKILAINPKNGFALKLKSKLQ